jgi:anaerobic magnesium-protoporphyrin IX monomethyl ester cyclase
MKVSLIGTYETPEATGLRIVSAFLKARGHRVRMIFLTARRTARAATAYPPTVIEQVLAGVRDCDLIGVGLMTGCYYLGRDLTDAIHRAGIKAPVIWGGVHATVSPESCIDHADIVCIGEGEWPMLDLVETLERGGDYTRIANLWVRRNGKVVRNDIRPLLENLDELPPPDYQIDQDHYVVQNRALVAATPANMGHTLTRYRILTTRGCPFLCAFCCNSRWRNLYQGKGSWVRRRSIGHVIAELEDIKARFPSVNSVAITDDTFFLREEEELEAFARLYRQRIALPFDAYAHPATLTGRKLEIVTGCGCWRIKMGIQAGNDETNFNIFNRRIPLAKVVQAIELLDRFPTLHKEYQYITCNPYESDEQRKQTLHFIAAHHHGQDRVAVFPLAFFPGTELYQRAKADGILKTEQRDIYQRSYTSIAKRRFDWLGYHVLLLKAVVGLRRYGVPAGFAHRFIDVMLARTVRWCLDRRAVMLAAVGAYLAGRKIHKSLLQTFVRPFRKRRKSSAGRENQDEPAFTHSA